MTPLDRITQARLEKSLRDLDAELVQLIKHDSKGRLAGVSQRRARIADELARRRRVGRGADR
jgi:hypothetical protein